MTPIFTLVRLYIFLVQAVFQRQTRMRRLLTFQRQVLEAQAQVQERLHRVRRTLAALTRRRRLHLAVEGLVHDAVAAVLRADLRPLAVPVPLVQLLGQELEELVRVLLLGGHQVLEGLLLGYPECRKNVGRSVTVRILRRVKFLKHVIHGTAQALREFAVAALVAVAEIEIT